MRILLLTIVTFLKFCIGGLIVAIICQSAGIADSGVGFICGFLGVWVVDYCADKFGPHDITVVFPKDAVDELVKKMKEDDEDILPQRPRVDEG